MTELIDKELVDTCEQILRFNQDKGFHGNGIIPMTDEGIEKSAREILAAAIKHVQESNKPYGYVSDATYEVVNHGAINLMPNNIFHNPLFTFPPNQEVEELKAKLSEAKDALEMAKNGIEWYVDNSVEANGCDTEALEAIDTVLEKIGAKDD